MTKPKDDYVLDTNKIKTFEDVANVFKCINVICDLNVLEKDDPRYKLIKEYFTVPYKEETPNSIEEILQEYEKKSKKLIENTHFKYRFGSNWLSMMRSYNEFCERQDEDFEYAKEHGKFKERIRGAYTTKIKPGSYIVSGDNGVTWTTTYNLGNGNAGYFLIQPNVKIYLDKKPNFVVRFCMDKLLGVRWVNEK